MHKTSVGMSAILASLALALGAGAQEAEMTFFVASVGSGQGADYGGLEGADAHCQSLAEAVGAGGHTWRAYLSATATEGSEAVDARDRIGSGPWHNVNGEIIASSVEELHGDNNLNKETALTENGETVNGRGDDPNMHDILTGSQPDGTAFESGEDTTCSNWTSSNEGSAIVGHHDRLGLRDDAPSRSWNSSHPSRGCSDEALRSTGGAGLIYCLAAD